MAHDRQAGGRTVMDSQRRSEQLAAEITDCDHENLLVVGEALRVYVAIVSRWSAPPYEQLGRAEAMLRRMREAGL